MGHFFHTILYVPLYNLLVFLVDIVPGGDFGVAIIILTIAIRIVIWPLSMSVARSQKAMKAIEPELKEIRTKYKDDKEKQMQEMIALYKRNNINPAASLLPILIQLPIVIALGYLMFHANALASVDTSLLYPFVHVPGLVSSQFLGHIAIAGHSIILAALAGLAQLAHAWYAIPVPPVSVEAGSSPSEDMARAMALQMRFVLPFIIAVAAYTSGGIALYLITTSLVSMLQEFIVRRTRSAASP